MISIEMNQHVLTEGEIDLLSGFAQEAGVSLAHSMKNHRISLEVAESICEGPCGLELSEIIIKAYKAGYARARRQSSAEPEAE
jgi:hypothetical protein